MRERPKFDSRTLKRLLSYMRAYKGTLVLVTVCILRKHIYASASIAGGILYLLLQQVWQGAGAILTSVVVVIVIRCAAAHFEWNLPRAKTVWKSDE